MSKKFRVFLPAVAAAGLTLVAVASAAQAKQGLVLQHARTGAPTQTAGYATIPELAVQQKSYKLGAAADPGFVFYSNADTDPATAKMTIFSPSGYTSALTQAPGTTVGKAYAIVKANQLGGSLLPLSGPVVVGNPADPALVAAYSQCKGASDPPTPQEVLVLNTSLQGQSIQVPDFLNTVGPYVTQEICLTPPAATPFQAQVVLANFTINGVFHNASSAGPYQWSTDLTPYAGNVPDAASTVEVRTLVGLPSSLSLKRAKSKPSIVKFTGKLSVSGINPAGLKLDLYWSTRSKPAADFTNPSLVGLTGKTRKPARTTKVKANGSFSVTHAKVRKRTFFQARLEDEWALQSCQGPSPTGLPIPCLEEILSPMNSNQIAVKPPKKKKHPLGIPSSRLEGLPRGAPQRSMGRSSWRDHSCHEPG